jgi:hypothetical protein
MDVKYLKKLIFSHTQRINIVNPNIKKITCVSSVLVSNILAISLFIMTKYDVQIPPNVTMIRNTKILSHCLCMIAFISDE